MSKIITVTVDDDVHGRLDGAAKAAGATLEDHASKVLTISVPLISWRGTKLLVALRTFGAVAGQNVPQQTATSIWSNIANVTNVNDLVKAVDELFDAGLVDGDTNGGFHLTEAGHTAMEKA